jgi:outer membrane protein OmpA-like peptidoglycan-associated protein/flagellar hook assembly protein FlgD
MKRSIGVLFTILLGTSPLFAEYLPPSGGEEVPELYSPSFVAGGVDVTSLAAIHGEAVNPAVGAFRERFTLHGGYVGLAGLGDTPENQGWRGNVVNVAGSLPTAWGVWGLGVHYVSSSLAGLDVGTSTRVRFSYARDLSPHFLLGAAAHATLGTKEAFDMGFALDLGFLHLPGNIGFLRDFRWGGTMQSMGKWFDTDTADDGDDRSAFPAPFTPMLGAGFSVYQTDELGVRLATNLSAPQFDNVRVGLQAELGFKEIFHLHGGVRFDLAQFNDERIALRPPFPSVGLRLNLSSLVGGTPSRRGNVQNQSRAELSLAPMIAGVGAVAAGVEIPIGRQDVSGPVIELQYPDVQYISPNNDGVQDYLRVPVRMHDEGLIKGWRFAVGTVGGKTVREIQNKDTRPENAGLNSLIEQLRAPEMSVAVPDAFLWDGTADDGSPVSDGQYNFLVHAWDDKGNETITEYRSVMLDRTVPTVTVSVTEPPNRLFSPNDDGNRDVLRIAQDGSTEESWEGRIVDGDGKAVRTYTWTDASPLPITWHGTNDADKPVPDGVYAYEIVSTDRAGNSARGRIDNIILNTETNTVFVTLGKTAFSPNGDGVHDQLTFGLYTSTTKGLTDWELQIVHEDGTVHKTFEGEETVPTSIEWNGLGTFGTVLQGTYTARYVARYQNGNEPTAESREFALDTAPPRAQIRVQPKPFSPDNDGVDDELFIEPTVQDAGKLASWSLQIYDPREKLFADFDGTGMPAERIRWDGRSLTGELVQAATDYPYRFTVSDAVGNATVLEGEIPVDVLVIREDGKLKIRITNITFDPNSPELATDDVTNFEKNIRILDRIAEILQKYRSYDIRIEGHAVRVHWEDEERGEQEEREELGPLSKARAETVKTALVERGVDADRLVTVGLGGTEPIVPHSNLDERWKNRRVEFVLIR